MDSTINLADVVSQLEFDNSSIRSQGFTALISIIKKKVKVPHADQLAARTQFFDCLSGFNDEISYWTKSCIHELVEEGQFTKDEVIEECLVRIGKTTGTRSCIQLIFSLSGQKLLRSCILILRKCPHACRIVIDELISCSNLSKAETSLSLFALLFCDEVVLIEKTRIIEYLTTEHKSSFQSIYSEYLANKFPLRADQEPTFKDASCDVTAIPLLPRDLFEIVRESRVRSEIFLNPSFPEHHVLLPLLLSLYSTWSEVSKLCPGAYSLDLIKKCKMLLSSCMKFPERFGLTESLPPAGSELTTFEYLLTVVAQKKEAGLLHSWIACLEKEESRFELSEESVLFICALLPYSSPEDVVTVFDLVSRVVAKVPSCANTLFPFYVMLLTRPYFPIPKNVVLRAMRKLITTRFLVVPVVKLFITVVQQKSPEGLLVIELLGELVAEFPTIFDMIVPCTDVCEQDDLNWIEARLKLMNSMFLAVDRSDDLLPKLTVLLKKSGRSLAASVKVLITLCREEILDLGAIRRQISSKVRQNGNELALVEYCHLLAVAVSLVEENEKTLRTDCVVELWQLRWYKKEEKSDEFAMIRAEAWKALAVFPLSEVMEATSTGTVQKIIDDIPRLGKIEAEGFSSFLRCMLSCDLDQLPRPLFTREFGRQDGVVGNAATWFDALGRTNAESPWLWTSSLFLFPSIVKTTSEARRQTAAMKLFRRLLCEVSFNAAIPTTQFLQLLAGWRIVVDQMLNNLANSRNRDFLWARDQLTEECGRALRQTEMSLCNVLMVTTLIGTSMYGMAEKISSTVVRDSVLKSMQPWLASVCQFVTDLTDGEIVNNSGTYPIFQMKVARNASSTCTARWCDWLLYRLSVQYSLERADGYTETQCYDPLTQELDLSLSPQVSLLLTGYSDEMGDFEWKGSRSLLWTIGTAFGLDPIFLSEVDDSISIDSSMRSRLEFLLNQDNGETTVESMKDLLNLCMELPSPSLLPFESKLKRKLERAWSNSQEFKRTIYEGISFYCLSTWNRSQQALPTDYSRLPEESLLRAVVATLSVDNLSVLHYQSILSSLSPLQRTDKRSLPPLDWAQLLSSNREKWNTGDPLPVLRLACQEKCAKLIYHLCSSTRLKSASTEYLAVLNEHITTVFGVIPRSRQDQLLSKWYELARRNTVVKEKVIDTLIWNLELQSVFDFVLSNLPRFDHFNRESAIDNPLLEIVMKDERELFRGKVNRLFDIWMDCNAMKGEKMNLRNIVAFYKGASEGERDTLLRIIGYSLTGKSREQIVEKMLDLVSLHNIDVKSTEQETISLLPIFLALVCASPAAIPLCWIGEKEDKVVSLLFGRWRYYWKSILDSEVCSKHTQTFRSFLLSHLSICTVAAECATIRELFLCMVSRSFISLDELLDIESTVQQKLFAISN